MSENGFYSSRPLIRRTTESQNMVQRSTLLMIGLGFTLGLTLGLLLQLPGVSSPLRARGRRDVSRGDAERIGASPHVLSPLLDSELLRGDTGIPENYNKSDLKRSGQTGHVPRIPSANIHSQHDHTVKPVTKQTSGQSNSTEGVSVLQIRIRQTKDTIETIKEQHGWNSSKSHGKQVDKKPANVASHRDASDKTPSTESGSKDKIVSNTKSEDQGSRPISSTLNIPHDNKNRQSLSGNSEDLHLQSDNLHQQGEGIPMSNELENHIKVSDDLPKDKFEVLSDEMKVEQIKQHSDSTINGESLFNGIYWSEEAEMMVPNSISDEETQAWRSKVNTQTVADLTHGCGRQQNRMVQFSDGSLACARYRINRDQIQGEVFSYYLAKLLGIQNVPPPVLSLPDPSDPRWSPVLDQLISAQWNSERTVVLTPWVENLNPVFIPEELRPVSRRLHPDSKLSQGRTATNVGELVQWSDMIILDYLTANVDRVVNNLFNLQWNSDMMSAAAHNLEKVGQNGPLVFLDNESGLFHSYRLLDKYSEYHESFLKALCVYRKSTATIVKKLAKEGQIGSKLAEIFSREEPLHAHLPLPRSNNIALLQSRLENVVKQIEYCDKLYKANLV